jgi:lipopolysaccharide export LptBFGC system permease protein LptF
VGLIAGIISVSKKRRGTAIAGLILSIIALVLFVVSIVLSVIFFKDALLYFRETWPDLFDRLKEAVPEINKYL